MVEPVLVGRLDGRVAIVTGGGQGIGEGIARRYAAEGAAVVVAELRADTGERVAAALAPPSRFVATDVTKKEDVYHAVQVALDEYGRLDVLVNNAYTGAGFAPLELKTEDDFARSLSGSFYGTLWAMQAAFPHMRDQGGGRIINLVSLNGMNAHMYSADYNATKEAIRTLTRTAAREWARYNILVNAIAPAAATPAYVRVCRVQPRKRGAAAEAQPHGSHGRSRARHRRRRAVPGNGRQLLRHGEHDLRRRRRPHQRRAVGSRDQLTASTDERPRAAKVRASSSTSSGVRRR